MHREGRTLPAGTPGLTERRTTKYPRAGVVKPIEILLIEDNSADADLTREKMEQAKIINRLHVVEDGETALEFLRKTGAYPDAPTPELILLDLNLPGKDGREVLAEIKHDDTLRLIPVVVLTSSDADEDIVRSYRLHANAYVRKPVDLAGYRKIVHAIDDFWLGLVRYSGRSQNEARSAGLHRTEISGCSKPRVDRKAST